MIRARVGIQYHGEGYKKLEQQATQLVGFMPTGVECGGTPKVATYYQYWVCYSRRELVRVMVALLELVTNNIQLVVDGDMHLVEWED